MDKIFDDPLADTNGLWVINQKGELIYIRAPIRVVCIIAVDDLLTGITYFVEAVVSTQGGLILYFIFNKPVRHSYFRIVERK